MRTWAFFILLCLVAGTACAANESESTPEPAKTDVGGTAPPPAPPASTPVDAGTKDTGAKPKNECKLSALSGVEDVTPSFVVVDPPAIAPATMTGGNLAGKYVVDGATVLLPSGAAGLVDTKTSTGTINAWAVFDGTNYRLHLKADFTIQTTIAGPQSQGVDTESQGGFTVDQEVILLDHACDAALGDEADYSFTDTGNGRASILIKTPTPYGDTYLQLDATKN